MSQQSFNMRVERSADLAAFRKWAAEFHAANGRKPAQGDWPPHFGKHAHIIVSSSQFSYSLKQFWLTAAYNQVVSDVEAVITRLGASMPTAAEVLERSVGIALF